MTSRPAHPAPDPATEPHAIDGPDHRPTPHRVVIHGHFYQPARDDPFTGQPPVVDASQPPGGWNRLITDECYAPNAEAGNFGRISWDLGPTLAIWLRRERPDVARAIATQGTGANGLAQAYHHTILPLASERDRRTEISWGLRDFEQRFGHRPRGLWLPETAMDLPTLRSAAELGVGFTILAPWQAAEPVDTLQPYQVDLGRGRSMIVAFYDGPLSAAVSFEAEATVDADQFAAQRLTPRLAEADHRPALLVIATDGELYGHHQPFRDLFLARLTKLGRGSGARQSPNAAGQDQRSVDGRSSEFLITSLGDVVAELDPNTLPEVGLQERTSWSCHHGIARWHAECPDATDGRWKAPLRAALDRLAGAIDRRTSELGREVRLDPWTARDAYVDVASEFREADDWANEHLETLARTDRARVVQVLQAQASRLSMFASDGWFWEDPRREETVQVVRFAAHAARTIDAATSADLEAQLIGDLTAVPLPDQGDGRELYEAAAPSEASGARSSGAA